MENASKALLIGAGMLIALLVISLLIMMFNSIGLFQSTKNKSDTSEQIAEFNMQFEAYNREDVLGIELVSLCNKINDFNTKYEDDGYTKITSNAFTFVNTEKNNNNKITSEFKGTKFKCKSVKYDSTGRVSQIDFEKVSKEK